MAEDEEMALRYSKQGMPPPAWLAEWAAYRAAHPLREPEFEEELIRARAVARLR